MHYHILTLEYLRFYAFSQQTGSAFALIVKHVVLSKVVFNFFISALCMCNSCRIGDVV